jgi:hypothetical protein
MLVDIDWMTTVVSSLKVENSLTGKGVGLKNRYNASSKNENELQHQII